MVSFEEVLKEIEEARKACRKVLGTLKFRDEQRKNGLELNSKLYGIDLRVLKIKVEVVEQKLREEIEEVKEKLNPVQLQEELIRRLAEVTAREETVLELERKVAIGKEVLIEEKKKLNKLYDDCIEIATKEVTKVKDEMVTVYCGKLEEVEELLDVVRTTDMPQFKLELFEQLKGVSPFEYSANSIEGVCSEDTELDLGQYTSMVVPNPVVIKVKSVTANPRKQATTRAKYSLEDVPVYKARVAELKAIRSVPWKEWVKTDEGKEHQRLTAAIRRLEKIL